MDFEDSDGFSPRSAFMITHKLATVMTASLVKGLDPEVSKLTKIPLSTSIFEARMLRSEVVIFSYWHISGFPRALPFGLLRHLVGDIVPGHFLRFHRGHRATRLGRPDISWRSSFSWRWKQKEKGKLAQSSTLSTDLWILAIHETIEGDPFANSSSQSSFMAKLMHIALLHWRFLAEDCLIFVVVK